MLYPVRRTFARTWSDTARAMAAAELPGLWHNPRVLTAPASAPPDVPLWRPGPWQASGPLPPRERIHARVAWRYWSVTGSRIGTLAVEP